MMKKLTISKQNSIIARAIEEDKKLYTILCEEGFTYDDLSYLNNPIDNITSAFTPIDLMDDMPMSNDNIPAVSFFSGAGGLDIGFKFAGFNNIIAIEHTELFCNTLRHNNPEQIVLGPPYCSGDVSNREEIAQLLLKHGVTEYFNGVFHGGPPCQSFSIAANQRFNKDGDNFKRTGFDDTEKGMLIFDYIWYIKRFKPLAFLIENVAGILECDSDGKISQALQELRGLGYNIPEPQVLDAAYYGVPQHRRRWFVLGIRGNTPIEYPTPNNQATPCGYVFTKSLCEAKNHITRMHNAESIQRYCKLELGERDMLGRVDRLNPYEPSKTVIAGGVKGGGRSHLHPFIPRTISVRECARLQTFPETYEFTGTYARQFTQVGNAVPPMLAYKIALQIKKAIKTR